MSKHVRAALAACVAIGVAAPAASAATPTTLAAHCAGLTLDSSGWPAGSKVWISVTRPGGYTTVRVNNRLVDASGVVHEKIRFAIDGYASSYRAQVVAPLGGPASVILAGTRTSCTPLWWWQRGSVVPMPADWLTSGGFTG